jgi:hypothetical protein
LQTQPNPSLQLHLKQSTSSSFGETIVTLTPLLNFSEAPSSYQSFEVTMPHRNTKYFEPGIVFTIFGLLHAALLISFAHGAITTTVTTTVTARTITIGTLPWTAGPTPPSQTISFQNPTNPSETFLFECPAGCNGGAACEWVSPANCSEYVNCDYRREPVLLACDEGLHFWDQLKQCAPPRQAKCTPSMKKRVGNQDL